MAKAPFKRTWKHGKSARGKDTYIICSYCKKAFPRSKAFSKVVGFKISDPSLRREINPKQIMFSPQKIYICPSCARFRGIVEPGKSRKSRKEKE